MMLDRNTAAQVPEGPQAAGDRRFDDSVRYDVASSVGPRHVVRELRAGSVRSSVVATVVVLGGYAASASGALGGIGTAVLGLVLLLGLPTAVLARRLDWKTRDPVLPVLLGLGLTVLAIIVGGLALNTALPAVGVERPLDSAPVLITCALVSLAIVWWRFWVPVVGPGDLRSALTTMIAARLEPAVALAALSAVLSVMGAVRLNNELPPTLAVIAHALAFVALGVAMFRRGGLGRDTAVVYLVGLALLLGTSMRGWFITGHDIQREFLVFRLTEGNGIWDMDAYRSAYNACLSVTILPTVISRLTSLDGITVFKVVLQLLAAALPVAVLILSRRIASPRLALLGTTLFLVFPTVMVDLPFLTRQAIALLFLALALISSTLQSWSVQARRVLVVVFGSGVALSHYSTTYLLLIALLTGMAGLMLVMARRAARRRRGLIGRRVAPEPSALILHPVVAVSLIVVTLMWSGPLTGSGGHFRETLAQSLDSLAGAGSSGPGSSDLNYIPFLSDQPSADERFDRYIDEAVQAREEDGLGDLLIRDPQPQELRPEVVEREPLPLTWAGRAIEEIGVDVAAVNLRLRMIVGALFQGFLVVGAIAIMLGRGQGMRLGRPDRWLLGGALVALGVVVVVPGLSAEYGVLRAFLQTLVVASPVVAIGAITCVAMFGRRAIGVASVLAVVMGFILTGVQASVVGGHPVQLALSNSGQYYDLYYVNGAERAAAAWLGDAAGPDQPVHSEVISDKLLVGRLPDSGDPVLPGPTEEFFPLKLRQDSFVFVPADTGANATAGIFYTGDLLSYRYPLETLERELDLVYSAGTVRIYR